MESAVLGTADAESRGRPAVFLAQPSPDPTVLLCIFASERSSPAKIGSLIRYLEEKRDRHQDDPDSMQVIDGVLSRAYQWIAPPDQEYRSLGASHEDFCSIHAGKS
jgi:hypothetical protein